MDRTVGGPHENYRTPEQEVPERTLDYPWETCMTMGDQWSFKPNDRYKSTRQLIHLLVDIVAKGGNFLGQYPYQSGTTASNCPSGYPGVENGLCVMPEPGALAIAAHDADAAQALAQRLAVPVQQDQIDHQQREGLA